MAEPRPSTRKITSELLHLSWPVILSVALAQIGAVVDRMMIGHLDGATGGAIPLAAVGYVHQFFHLLQSVLMAVGLACVALMARAIGAGEPAQARRALATSIQLAVLTTSALAGTMLLFGQSLIEALGAEPTVVVVALPYFRYVIGSTVIMAAAMVIENGLRANRNTRTPMWIALAVTTVKLGGNWILIFGKLGFPALGLVGAGMATAAGHGVGLGLFLWIVLRQPAESPLALRSSDWQVSRLQWRKVVRIAAPGIGERILLNLALLAYFWVLSHNYGTVAVAVYSVGVPLLSFTWVPGVGYGQAVATLVGQSLGRDRPEDARRAGWCAAALGLGTAVLLGVPFALARDPLARAFTDDPAVIAGLGPFLLALAVAQPFLQVHFALGGAHRGAGDTWTPLKAAAISTWGLRVPVAVVCASWLGLTVEWVWIAIVFDHAVRAGYLGSTFRKGNWLRAVPTGEHE